MNSLQHTGGNGQRAVFCLALNNPIVGVVRCVLSPTASGALCWRALVVPRNLFVPPCSFIICDKNVEENREQVFIAGVCQSWCLNIGFDCETN